MTTDLNVWAIRKPVGILEASDAFRSNLDGFNKLDQNV